MIICSGYCIKKAPAFICILNVGAFLCNKYKVTAYLRGLRLSTIRRHHAEHAVKAVRKSLSYGKFLYELLVGVFEVHSYN